MPHAAFRAASPAPAPTRADPVVLVTRPEPGATRFARRLQAEGLRTVVAPLMRIVPVDHDAAALRQARGLIFTSAHAVPAAGPGRGRRAICVGPATAEAADRAGFDVTVGPGDAAGLMPMLADLGDGWLHPHGRHVAAELPVPGIVVYDQEPMTLPADAARLLRTPAPVIVPVFSPRSARLAAAAVARALAPADDRGHAGPTRADCIPLAVAAISRAAAAAWTPPPPALATAPTPDADGMMIAIRSLLARKLPQPRRVEPPGGPA